MNAKTKPVTSLMASVPSREPRDGFWLTPVWTLEDRVERIEAMAERINGYIQAMCHTASLNGTSAEAKERGVAAFYERMVIVESQLRRIHDELRLE